MAKRSTLRLVGLVGLALLGMFGLQILFEWNARVIQIRETQTSLLNLASSLIEQADSTLEIADATIAGVVARLESEGGLTKDSPRLERELVAQVSAGRRIHSITVLAADGHRVAPVMPGVDFSDRAYFRHARDNPDRGPFIGPAIRGRPDGEWYITVSRRIQQADGTFAGVVRAAIKLSYFVDHYAKYNLGDKSSITLAFTDGTMLARYPPREDLIGQSLLRGIVFTKLRENTSGTYFTKAIVDGMPRFGSYRRSELYPTVAVVAMAEAQVLGDWRTNAWEDLAVTFAFSAVVALLGLHLLRQVRRRQSAERVRESERKFRLQAETLQAAESRERIAAEASNARLDKLSRQLATARNRAEQASQAKSRFLTGMSHELRTPLNGILGYAQLLRMDGGLNVKQSVRVDAMLSAGKHLLQMITSVLDMSEIETGRIELRTDEFDVQDLAEECLELVRPMAEARGLTLRVDVAPGLNRLLVGDPMRLRQVLLNLLGNGAKFTSKGSVEVRLRALAEGATIRIEVADTGAGVPTEHRSRLFQDFGRLDNEATRTAEGSGLGLALSARLAGLMGGRIGYADNAGGGSVFWLELPAGGPSAVAPALPAAIASKPAAAAPLARVLHVLVVDDILINRDIAASLLAKAGHRATCVDSGAKAVTAVAGTDFDVVLMDVRMPGMDGLEATRRIRALATARGRVPIVALTAQAFTDQAAACREAGMASHLSKPFDMVALLAAVSRAVDTQDASPQSVDPPAERATAAPPAQGKSAHHAELPVLNMETFKQAADHFSPQLVAVHMRKLEELGEPLLHRLRHPDGSPLAGGPLADAAHALAGGAGLFGFERLAALCVTLERAATSGEVEPALAEQLCESIEAARRAVRDRTPDGVGDLISLVE